MKYLLAIVVYIALRSLGISAGAIIIGDLAILLMLGFYDLESERKHRAVAFEDRKDADIEAFLYASYNEPDVPRWVARVHWEQERSFGSGNGRISSEDGE